jgi:hypothetical protein
VSNSERDPTRLLEAYYDPIVKEADPCLFCNGTLLAIAEWKSAPIIPRPTWRIFCVSCGTLGPIGDSKRMAVDSWNRNSEVKRLVLKAFRE